MARTVAVARASTFSRKRVFPWWRVLIYLFLGIFCLTCLGPLIFTFNSSFKNMQDVLAFPP